VLIRLSPSEGKGGPARRGRPLDLAELCFPELTATRDRLGTGLTTVSAAPDPLTRLAVGPGLAAEVAVDVRLPADDRP